LGPEPTAGEEERVFQNLEGFEWGLSARAQALLGSGEGRFELELELIQTHITQKPILRVEVSVTQQASTVLDSETTEN
jgi:hypothetical protein